MKFSAQNIADFLNGEVEGNPDVLVDNISKIEEGKEGTLTFLANLKYSKYIYSTDASIVLVNKDFHPEKEIKSTLIRVDDAYQAFASLLDMYNQAKPVKKGIEKYSFIDDSASIGKDVYIGAFTYIGENAKIGDNVKIYPHTYIGENVEVGDNTILNSGAKIYNETKIGKDCILHSGVVIGADGFGFAPQSDSNYKKVPQIGNVIIEDNVEIGANTAIDRATIGSTIIRKGVKLDNLIQIAHNVEIDSNTVIAAQSGVSGSTKVGKNCLIGGQVGIVGHISIADDVKIAAQSGVPSEIKNKGEIVQGSPSFNISDYKKSYVVFKRLPELRNQILSLQKELDELKKQI